MSFKLGNSVIMNYILWDIVTTNLILAIESGFRALEQHVLLTGIETVVFWARSMVERETHKLEDILLRLKNVYAVKYCTECSECFKTLNVMQVQSTYIFCHIHHA